MRWNTNNLTLFWLVLCSVLWVSYHIDGILRYLGYLSYCPNTFKDKRMKERSKSVILFHVLSNGWVLLKTCHVPSIIKCCKGDSLIYNNAWFNNHPYCSPNSLKTIQNLLRPIINISNLRMPKQLCRYQFSKFHSII